MTEQEIRVGDRVEILQPDYVAGKFGKVLTPELVQDGQLTGRWIVKVEHEEVLLSLLPEELRVVS
ncbi:hypothetical protein [Leptolyngbya sp. FACHB-711]|uniref:hypothetical protein n=1 Tax=unclassified Leptolyngbya TaxID=2650499 RepID=UPI001686C810|nr:hypothetical protein [Leptolyngbya sp. FACHB-711]MBD2025517.1 hypothetical protein [Leptolyngbya sp. FACHB-711]